MRADTNKYTVAFASNERGVYPLCVAAWSVVENAAPETSYDICILSDGITEESKQKLTSLITKAGSRHSIRFFDAEHIVKLDVGSTEHWPKATWARIFLADVLPEVNKALYLDIDTLVCTDLTPLFSIDMKDAALGVVLEYESHLGSGFNDRLDIPQSCLGYFNAGVLLMNLDAFRRDGLISKVMNFAANYKSVLTCLDQDALNGALCDRLIQLHPRWNWHDGLTRRIIKSNPNDKLWHGNSPKTSVEAALWPGILHYQGTHKPWFYNHRIEGPRYEASLRRAGLIDANSPLPGFNVRDWFKSLLYKPIYASTWKRIKRLAIKLNAQKPE